MQREIIQNVKIRTKRKKYRFSHVAAVVLIIILSGIISVPVREDNCAFTITYYWNGVFTRFQESQFSNYQEKYEDIKESVEEVEINLFFEKIENVE